MIRHRLTTDESYRRDWIRTLTKLSKQKRVGIHPNRLIFALIRAQNELPLARRPRVSFLKLQKISSFENARHRVQHTRSRQWRARSQRGIGISRQVAVTQKHSEVGAICGGRVARPSS